MRSKYWVCVGLALVSLSNKVVLADFSFNPDTYVAGMNLTEEGTFLYDAAIIPAAKTHAQTAVDQIKKMGARHVILNPRAIMVDPRSNELLPMTRNDQRGDERARYKRLIDYIHGLGMTVGIRPIFFVVHPDGTFPYKETQPDGSSKVWWHGNIQPSDPNRWFDSFKAYLDSYLLISKLNRVEEFTIGAELYSMTVGIEDQWEEHPHGFPGRWLELLRYAKRKLGTDVRMMYDINFTDDTVNAGGISASGGEMERWRYRIVDLAHPTDPTEKVIWENLVAFWNELDAVGIDMYRSLAGLEEAVPTERVALIQKLRVRSDEYAGQMDTTAVSIEATTGKAQKFIFKEAGYRSVERGFVDPFRYENEGGEYNALHQAVAYEALFQSFWVPRFPWFQGGSFWDVGVNPMRNQGVGDRGFSPVGKPETLEVLQRIFAYE